MLITIRHTLNLDFGELVPRLLLHLLLTPQTGPSQRVLDWTMALSVKGHEVPLIDGFGNRVTFASLANIAEPVEIVVAGRIETLAGNGVLGWPTGEPVPWLFHRVTPTTRVPATVWGKYRAEASQRDSLLGALHGLMERIHELFAAATDNADAEQSQSQSQGAGATASQSQSQANAGAEPRGAVAHAETFVGSARALGVPARFVSGYFVSDDEAVPSGTHQWAEAYVEGLGWIGFDPLLNLCPTDRHIRMAVGLDALTAVPVRAYPPLASASFPVETVKIDIAADVA